MKPPPGRELLPRATFSLIARALRAVARSGRCTITGGSVHGRGNVGLRAAVEPYSGRIRRTVGIIAQPEWSTHKQQRERRRQRALSLHVWLALPARSTTQLSTGADCIFPDRQATSRACYERPGLRTRARRPRRRRSPRRNAGARPDGVTPARGKETAPSGREPCTRGSQSSKRAARGRSSRAARIRSRQLRALLPVAHLSGSGSHLQGRLELLSPLSAYGRLQDVPQRLAFPCPHSLSCQGVTSRRDTSVEAESRLRSVGSFSRSWSAMTRKGHNP